MDKKQQDYGGMEPVQSPSTTMGDVFAASLESVARNYNYGAEHLFTTVETSQRDKRYRDLTGRSIEDDAFEAAPNKEEIRNQLPGDPSLKGGGAMGKAIDNYLNQLKEKDPEKYAKVLNSEQIKEAVKTKAKDSMIAQAKATDGATGFDAVAGSIGGGLVASFADPINLATIPLGAPKAFGILKTALFEAGVNVGAEVLSYPSTKKWQEELGQEYGAKEFMENATMGAGFGFLVGGGVKALSVGLEKMSIPNSAKLATMRSKLDEIDNVEGVEAFRHEERRLHIEEADPAKYGVEVNPELHARALEETDAAVNEGRPVRVDVPDEEIRKMDPAMMDDGAKAVFKEMKAKDVEPVFEINGQKPNEIFNEQRSVTPSLERQEELLTHYESPEYKAMEQAEFAKAFPDPNERITLDDGTDIGVSELREQFKNEKSYLDAISSCTLAGFKVAQ